MRKLAFCKNRQKKYEKQFEKEATSECCNPVFNSTFNLCFAVISVGNAKTIYIKRNNHNCGNVFR